MRYRLADLICSRFLLSPRLWSLRKARKVAVVIDEREENVRNCIARGYHTLQGDATSDVMLCEAGIGHAKYLLVAIDSDAHDISITLPTRHLNSKLFIVARFNHY